MFEYSFNSYIQLDSFAVIAVTFTTDILEFHISEVVSDWQEGLAIFHCSVEWNEPTKSVYYSMSRSSLQLVQKNYKHFGP